MLYLMLDENKEKCFAKVGYTSDRKKGEHNSRVAAYRTHNPCAILKDWHAGNKEEERRFRAKLLKHEGSERLTNSEWVVVSEELYNKLLAFGFAAID